MNFTTRATSSALTPRWSFHNRFSLFLADGQRHQQNQVNIFNRPSLIQAWNFIWILNKLLTYVCLSEHPLEMRGDWHTDAETNMWAEGSVHVKDYMEEPNTQSHIYLNSLPDLMHLKRICIFMQQADECADPRVCCQSWCVAVIFGNWKTMQETAGRRFCLPLQSFLFPTDHDCMPCSQDTNICRIASHMALAVGCLVCLLAWLPKNYWMDFTEAWWKDGEWAQERHFNSRVLLGRRWAVGSLRELWYSESLYQNYYLYLVKFIFPNVM